MKKRRSLLKKTKGYRWTRKSSIKQAKTAFLKAGANAYVGRKLKKREYRSLWQIRIGNAAKELGISYSKLMGALKKNNIDLDRKVLADLAVNNPKVFAGIVAKVK